jgi:hypothetical protein
VIVKPMHIEYNHCGAISLEHWKLHDLLLHLNRLPLEEISKRAHEELVQIPGVSNLSFGKTFTDRGKGYTHILALDLPDVSGLTHRFPPSILFGIS